MSGCVSMCVRVCVGVWVCECVCSCVGLFMSEGLSACECLFEVVFKLSIVQLKY